MMSTILQIEDDTYTQHWTEVTYPKISSLHPYIITILNTTLEAAFVSTDFLFKESEKPLPSWKKEDIFSPKCKIRVYFFKAMSKRCDLQANPSPLPPKKMQVFNNLLRILSTCLASDGKVGNVLQRRLSYAQHSNKMHLFQSRWKCFEN